MRDTTVHIFHLKSVEFSLRARLILSGRIVLLAITATKWTREGMATLAGCNVAAVLLGQPAAAGTLTMRAELIGHFQPCMTEIYLHI